MENPKGLIFVQWTGFWNTTPIFVTNGFWLHRIGKDSYSFVIPCPFQISTRYSDIPRICKVGEWVVLNPDGKSFWNQAKYLSAYET